MHRLPTLVLVLLALLLPACGLGGGDNIYVVDPPTDSGTMLDDELTAALAAAGVTAIAKPTEDAPALVTLGQALFFDKLLSGNENISCATCHHPVAATGDALPLSLGEGGFGVGATRDPGTGEMIPRNAPHVFNGGVAGVNQMFWDSRVRRDPVTGVLDTPEPDLNGSMPVLADYTVQLTSALAAQALFPVTSPEEMRGQSGTNLIADAASNEDVWILLMERLVGTNDGTAGGFDAYRALFLAAFPSIGSFDELTFGHAGRAMAAFQRSAWTALDTPLDRYLEGDHGALSESAKRGALVFFGKAGCAECHNGPLLSDFQHHAVAAPQLGPGKGEPAEDRGLALLTFDSADDYKFRTPALRNVALTGPWLHDGAFTTLEAVVRHKLDPLNSLSNYDGSQLPALFAATVDVDPARNAARAAALDPLFNTPVGLGEGEFSDLMSFLNSLTDPASLNLLGDLPDTVPSGLPVRD